MSFVKCNKCGGHINSLDNKTVIVTITKSHKCCEHCNNIRTHDTAKHFCCTTCFNDYFGINDELIDWNKAV